MYNEMLDMVTKMSVNCRQGMKLDHLDTDTDERIAMRYFDVRYFIK